LRLGTRLVLNLDENYDITYRIQNIATKIQLRILAKNPHSVVVRRPDSAIHQIVIFQALLNQSLIGITRVLKFSIYKLNVF
jgi:hypothetical protein